MKENEQKEFISLQGQTMCDASSLKDGLIRLRSMIRELAMAVSDDKHVVTVCEFARSMFILDWLIEDIKFKD